MEVSTTTSWTRCSLTIRQKSVTPAESVGCDVNMNSLRLRNPGRKTKPPGGLVQTAEFSCLMRLDSNPEGFVWLSSASAASASASCTSAYSSGPRTSPRRCARTNRRNPRGQTSPLDSSIRSIESSTMKTPPLTEPELQSREKILIGASFPGSPSRGLRCDHYTDVI